MSDVVLLVIVNGRLLKFSEHYHTVRKILYKQTMCASKVPRKDADESIPGECLPYILLDCDSRLLVNAQTVFALDDALRKEWMVLDCI